MLEDLFRFIGEDGSLGYEKGRVYLLQLEGRGFYKNVRVTAPVRCIYDNWDKFLENWERV